LIENREYFQNLFVSLQNEMYGGTPMFDALKIVSRRIENECKRKQYGMVILFLLSDGEASDDKDGVIYVANQLQNKEVIIVSCYMSEHNISDDPKYLHSKPNKSWTDGALTSFSCASVLPDITEIRNYLNKNGWKMESNCKLFAQVNNSDLLADFFNVVFQPFLKHVDH